MIVQNGEIQFDEEHYFKISAGNLVRLLEKSMLKLQEDQHVVFKGRIVFHKSISAKECVKRIKESGLERSKNYFRDCNYKEPTLMTGTMLDRKQIIHDCNREWFMIDKHLEQIWDHLKMFNTPATVKKSEFVLFMRFAMLAYASEGMQDMYNMMDKIVPIGMAKKFRERFAEHHTTGFRSCCFGEISFNYIHVKVDVNKSRSVKNTLKEQFDKIGLWLIKQGEGCGVRIRDISKDPTLFKRLDEDELEVWMKRNLDVDMEESVTACQHMYADCVCGNWIEEKYKKEFHSIFSQYQVFEYLHQLDQFQGPLENLTSIKY